MDQRYSDYSMNEIFGKQGLLEAILPQYEFRGEQLAMAEFIQESLYNQETAFVEAGTGTGKTLAYLIPVLMYALENEKKVIISTETKALQKQLIDKDIPLVAKMFLEHRNLQFNYALCLGGGNYPCLMRFESIVTRGAFSQKDMKVVQDLEKRFAAGDIFTVFDIDIPRRLWTEINRESDACNSYRCRHSSQCVYLKARRQWADANVLVINHYLFFSNIMAGKSYLPQAAIAVFDEAHSLEEIACQQLGFTLRYDTMREMIIPFSREGKKSILRLIEDEGIREAIASLVPDINTEIDRYFQNLQSVMHEKIGSVRLREPLSFGSELVKKLQDFIVTLNALDKCDLDEPRRVDGDIARGRLFQATEYLNSFVYQRQGSSVYWIEREGRALVGDVCARSQPVDIAEMVNTEFSCYDSCVCISATLAVEKDFSYIVDKLGVTEYRSLALESSFDYKKQMIVYVDGAIDAPDSVSYIDHAADISAQIISHLNGNCLLLFTSYKTLGDVKALLKKKILMQCYSQDEFPPSEAIDKYLNDQNSVLLGTHSFWQGIDLPGDLLRGVIMTRLPFSVPDSPPMEAKIERIIEKGGNPFFTLQLPEAILRFKQGFGRLIRSRDDKGVVAVLDSRIIKKAYGKFFLKSIPECRIVYSIEEMKAAYNRL